MPLRSIAYGWTATAPRCRSTCRRPWFWSDLRFGNPARRAAVWREERQHVLVVARSSPLRIQDPRGSTPSRAIGPAHGMWVVRVQDDQSGGLLVGHVRRRPWARMHAREVATLPSLSPHPASNFALRSGSSGAARVACHSATASSPSGRTSPGSGWRRSSCRSRSRSWSSPTCRSHPSRRRRLSRARHRDDGEIASHSLTDDSSAMTLALSCAPRYPPSSAAFKAALIRFRERGVVLFANAVRERSNPPAAASSPAPRRYSPRSR